MPLTDLVTVAAWIGLAGGILEIGGQLVRGAWSTPIVFLGRGFVWSAPVALAAVCVAGALAAAATARLLPRMNALRATVLLSGLVAVWSPLMLVPGLHHAASLLLAAGVGARLSAVAARRPAATRALARRGLPVMLVVVALLGLGVHGTDMARRWSAGSGRPSPPDSPNVLVIVLDTVRARNMSLYGYERPTTPELEALAEESVVFDRAIATAPWTLPSHAGIFTGRPAHELATDWQVPLGDTHATLAGYLGSLGYDTGGIVANLGYCSYQTGLDRGFRHWEDYVLSVGQVAYDSKLLRTVLDNFRLRTLIRNDEHINRKTATSVNDRAMQWLSDRDERPFFLFLNYFDAHEPYLPPPPFDTAFGGREHPGFSPLHHYLWDPAVDSLTDAQVEEEIAAYDGAIAYLDHMVVRLLEWMRQAGLLEDTLVVITSDHGEEFGEQGLFDHGNSLYIPALHVPLLLRYPAGVPTGVRVPTAVSLADIPATVVDVLELRDPAPLPGISLSRHWETSARPGADAVLSEVSQGINTPEHYPVSRGDMKSVVGRGHHYILNGDGIEELYDLDADPLETENLAADGDAADLLQELRRALARLLARERDGRG